MKRILKSALVRRSSDILLSPLTLVSAVWYKFVRSNKASQMPVTEKIFMAVGVLPIRDHYYQPLINPQKYLQKPLHAPRVLPGIQWNIEEQLNLLKAFHYQDELRAIPMEQKDAGPLGFYYNNNPSLCAADAEFLYNIIRHYKPRRIIEVGCGYSTRLAVQAEKKNLAENSERSCTHICIEPYEAPWLEKLAVQVLRSKVEDLPLDTFSQLEAGDILFIDSSHIIRPQGDVLFEFLEILPTLKPGVLVHVHDIFSPRDYLKDWVVDQHSQWNEQYLLEAFLSFNSQFRIIGAVNLLKKDYPKALAGACPVTGERPNDEPGSFWMIRN